MLDAALGTTLDLLVEPSAIYPDDDERLWDERVRDLKVADVFKARFGHSALSSSVGTCAIAVSELPPWEDKATLRRRAGSRLEARGGLTEISGHLAIAI